MIIIIILNKIITEYHKVNQQEDFDSNFINILEIWRCFLGFGNKKKIFWINYYYHCYYCLYFNNNYFQYSSYIIAKLVQSLSFYALVRDNINFKLNYFVNLATIINMLYFVEQHHFIMMEISLYNLTTCYEYYFDY